MTGDRDLVQRLQAGDKAAWKDTANQYYKGLVLFCGRYVRNQSDVKDLVHDTFVKAMANIAKFDSKRYTSIKPWLWQIARNTALNYIKSRKLKDGDWQPVQPSQSTTTGTFLKLIDNRPGPRTLIHSSEKYKILFDCLDKLDEKFTEVVFLHYMDGLTRKQMAELLDIPENTVKSRLRLALEKLRLALPTDLKNR